MRPSRIIVLALLSLLFVVAAASAANAAVYQEYMTNSTMQAYSDSTVYVGVCTHGDGGIGTSWPVHYRSVYWTINSTSGTGWPASFNTTGVTGWDDLSYNAYDYYYIPVYIPNGVGEGATFTVTLTTSSDAYQWDVAEPSTTTVTIVGRPPATTYNYGYGQLLTTSGSAANQQTQFTVYNTTGTSSGTNLYLNGHAKNWPNDIRFVDAGNNNVLPYWVENGYSASQAYIWVNVSTLSGSHINVLYGNSSDPGAQNGAAVFPFFDDFSGAALDTNKWTYSAGSSTLSFSNGVMDMHSAGTSTGTITSKSSFTNNYVLHQRIYNTQYGSNGYANFYPRSGDVQYQGAMRDTAQGATWSVNSPWNTVVGTWTVANAGALSNITLEVHSAAANKYKFITDRTTLNFNGQYTSQADPIVYATNWYCDIWFDTVYVSNWVSSPVSYAYGTETPQLVDVGVINVYVTNGAGTYIDGAEVNVTSASGVVHLYTTDASGHVNTGSLTPGTYTVTANKYGVASGQTVAVVAGQTITVNLGLGTSSLHYYVSGWVKNMDNEPIDGARVDLSTYNTTVATYGTAYTTSDGWFNLTVNPNTPEGSYVIKYSATGYAPDESDPVTYKYDFDVFGGVFSTFMYLDVVRPPTPGDVIWGYALDTFSHGPPYETIDGEKVYQSTVVTIKNAATNEFVCVNGSVAETGYYKVTLPENLPAGLYAISANASSYMGKPVWTAYSTFYYPQEFEGRDGVWQYNINLIYSYEGTVTPVPGSTEYQDQLTEQQREAMVQNMIDQFYKFGNIIVALCMLVFVLALLDMLANGGKTSRSVARTGGIVTREIVRTVRYAAPRAAKTTGRAAGGAARSAGRAVKRGARNVGQMSPRRRRGPW